MPLSLQFAIIVPITISWVASLGAHALAMRRDKRYPESWGATVIAIAPSLLPVIYFATGGDVSVAMRNITVGIFGAAVGATFAIWLAYQVSDWRAQAQPAAPNTPIPSSPTNTPAPIIAPNNSGVIAPNNSGTITQNQGAPRIALGLYQSGQLIGRVQEFFIGADGKQITFRNPRLGGGAIDPNGNIEFQNLIVSCPSLMRMASPNAGMNAIAVGGDVLCSIVGKI